MRVKVRKKPAPAVVSGKRANLNAELIPEVSEKKLRHMVSKLSKIFDENPNTDVIGYTNDCMLSDFIRKLC